MPLSTELSSLRSRRVLEASRRLFTENQKNSEWHPGEKCVESNSEGVKGKASSGLSPGKTEREVVTKPSVILADDDAAFLKELRKLLEPEFKIAQSVGDGKALIEAAQTLTPDLIVADISMSHFNGFQALRRLKAALPNARVIFLTVHEEPAFVAEARKSGALGYVFKRRAPSDLIPAIRAILKGGPFVCPALQE